MYEGEIYGKKFRRKDVTSLLREASGIANNFSNPIDELIITDAQGIHCEFTRINKKYPNNTIERGKWR